MHFVKYIRKWVDVEKWCSKNAIFQQNLEAEASISSRASIATFNFLQKVKKLTYKTFGTTTDEIYTLFERFDHAIQLILIQVKLDVDFFLSSTECICGVRVIFKIFKKLLYYAFN